MEGCVKWGFTGVHNECEAIHIFIRNDKVLRKCI